MWAAQVWLRDFKGNPISAICFKMTVPRFIYKQLFGNFSSESCQWKYNTYTWNNVIHICRVRRDIFYFQNKRWLFTTNLWSVEFSLEEDNLTTYLLENPGRSLIVPQKCWKVLNNSHLTQFLFTIFLPLNPHLTVTAHSTIFIPYAYMAGMIQLKERFILNLIQISTTPMVSCLVL